MILQISSLIVDLTSPMFHFVLKPLFLFLCFLIFMSLLFSETMNTHRATNSSSPTKMIPSSARGVARTILSEPEIEAGYSIRRPIGGGQVGELMPFLLLDDIDTRSQISGFSEHPHRGQETITYMFEGSLVHQDNKGNKGVIGPGDLQVMLAGRGIVHRETPVTDPVTNTIRGIQLWVALPASNSFDHPTYKDLVHSDCLVIVPTTGVHIKLISGESFGYSAPVLTKTPVWFFDIELGQGARISHPIPKDWNCFVLLLSGSIVTGGKAVKPHEIIIFKRDGNDHIELENNGVDNARLLLLAGDPLDGQELHRHGPFVSYERGGISKALRDYEMGINGFEGAHQWTSEPVNI